MRSTIHMAAAFGVLAAATSPGPAGEPFHIGRLAALSGQAAESYDEHVFRAAELAAAGIGTAGGSEGHDIVVEVPPLASRNHADRGPKTLGPAPQL